MLLMLGVGFPSSKTPLLGLISWPLVSHPPCVYLASVMFSLVAMLLGGGYGTWTMRTVGKNMEKSIMVPFLL